MNTDLKVFPDLIFILSTKRNINSFSTCWGSADAPPQQHPFPCLSARTVHHTYQTQRGNL